jgi:dihydrofolate reductase
VHLQLPPARLGQLTERLAVPGTRPCDQGARVGPRQRQSLTLSAALLLASTLYVHRPDGELGGSRPPKDVEEFAKISSAEALSSAALLLGRRSDEWFGARWPSRTGDWADRLNSMPKYVVSSTLQDPVWTNVTVLKGDAVEEVTRLKQELDGDIVVYASYRLGRALLEHDLVDELRLFVFPVVVGAGERLFGETSGEKPFRLTGSRTAGEGLVYVTYEIAGGDA